MMEEPVMRSIPVLIVGGGVSGLSAAAFLGHQGVASLLVERHHDHPTHPRMSGAGPRSMELFRGIGLEPRIRSLDEGAASVIMRAATLSGREIERYSMGGAEEVEGISPTEQIWFDQDQLEPVLRETAAGTGADIRFGTELAEFEQHADGVRAVIRDRASGAEETVHASYLLACDGIHSPVRERLGIGRSGPGILAHQAGILFRADLSAAVRDRNFLLCLLDDIAGGRGDDHLHVLLRRNRSRWTLSVPYYPDKGESPEDFTRERCTELIHAAVGRQDIDVQVLDVDTWPMQVRMADSFASGRVFVVGDAAHCLPPTGGFGGNSCIHDAHNLAWKLAEVLSGRAGPGLLDSYEAERRPVAQVLLEESAARAGLFLAGDAEGGSGQPPDRPPKANIMLGYRYRSGAVAAEPATDDGEPVEDALDPSGRPGTRAPHLVVEDNGERVSTLDLFDRGFVLLAGAEGAAWQRAATAAAERTRVALTCRRLTPSGHPFADLVDVDGRWSATYRVGPVGAALVRPDGFIAWRSTEAVGDPEEELVSVLKRLLDLPPAVAADGAQHEEAVL
ncbi:FAD-dependent monooxygenase [Streptomonospora wellingtoniae]|uniref:FAD-dependent monooxygenase n=1 Tax=Streptomonospora wellingtoniae TaxID=3075544 RepID=A0ABU2KXM8_9ACTN|nr:FAD-dependent monooxygenase [Streptomonospora sp. DSM 45055]MDT0303937.1 FAD-dependent monooxygenase [Streptomonospora sp. DSM 45055]